MMGYNLAMGKDSGDCTSTGESCANIPGAVMAGISTPVRDFKSSSG